MPFFYASRFPAFCLNPSAIFTLYVSLPPGLWVESGRDFDHAAPWDVTCIEFGTETAALPVAEWLGKSGPERFVFHVDMDCHGCRNPWVRRHSFPSRRVFSQCSVKIVQGCEIFRSTPTDRRHSTSPRCKERISNICFYSTYSSPKQIVGLFLPIRKHGACLRSICL